MAKELTPETKKIILEIYDDKIKKLQEARAEFERTGIYFRITPWEIKLKEHERGNEKSA